MFQGMHARDFFQAMGSAIGLVVFMYLLAVAFLLVV